MGSFAKQAVNFSPVLLLLFLYLTLSGLVRISKTNYRWSGIFADVAASEPTRKKNIQVPYGTKTTQEVVKGLIIHDDLG